MRCVITFVVWGLLGIAVCAQTPPLNNGRPSNLDAALQEAFKVAISGKSDVMLLSEGMLHVPEGFVFVPQPEAGRIVQAMGNAASDSLIGLILPSKGSKFWLLSVSFIHSGYIADDGAKTWQSDSLLAQIRAQTVTGNSASASKDSAGFDAIAWQQPPVYDAAAHHLVWSTQSHQMSKPASVLTLNYLNYNAYAFGREGFFTFSLLTPVEDVGLFHQQAGRLLSAIEYNNGKRYEEFNAANDVLAAYKIDALVAGLPTQSAGGMRQLAGVHKTTLVLLLIPLVISVAAITAMVLRKKKRIVAAAR